MPLRRNFLLSVAVLVACNVLLAFGAIGLLTRMSPAIERILLENVYSTEAAEDLLALLALPAPALSADDRQQRFEDTLQRLRENATEPQEVPVLERVVQRYGAALAGDERAVVAVVQALQHLATVNRQAMASADQEAQRLGIAGAWVAVCIAVLSFVISLMVIRRLERHVLNPLIELHDVLDAVREGNHHRRCRIIEAPEEIRSVLHAVNALLDRGLHDNENLPYRRASSHTIIARGALLHLLEQHPTAVVLVDERGDIVASNSRGLAVLSSLEGAQVKRQLAQLPAEPEHDHRIEAVPLKDVPGWLCVLHLPAQPV
jgi:nitrogen fixation/metabolism regulation signal transduction histidine kinase